MNLVPRYLRALVAVAAIACLSLPAFALDPHYAGSITVKDKSFTSTVAAQVNTVTSLTPATVNSGTNSFLLLATVKFSVPTGTSVHIQLSKTVSSTTTVFTDTQQVIRGDGSVHLQYSLDSVAASTTINVDVLMDVAGLPVRIERATLTAVGLAGATQ